MKRWIRTLFMAAALLAILYARLPQYAAALSCAQPLPIDKLYENSDGIILGEVQKVTRNNDSNTVRVKVHKSYKGVTDASLSLNENVTWGSLWGPSEEGQEYLFFLKKSGSEWENPLCSPTRKQADATKELAFLQGKEIPLNNASAPQDASGSNRWLIAGVALCISGLAGFGAYRMARRRR